MFKKYIQQFLTIFGIFVSSSLFAQDLSVMTFNIRLSVESDGENAWSKRKDDAISLLNYYQPTFFGVQEAVPQQMIDINKGLQNYDFVGVGRDDGANKGEFSALFYDTSKLTVLESGTFWLSSTPNQVSMGWDAACNRVCTYALFKTKKGGKKFWAFNTHFDHVGNEARKNSAQLILKKIQELNTKNYPVVLTGDFNLTEDSEPIKKIAAQLDDAYHHSLKKPYGPKGTFTAFNVNTIPDRRIDFIFVKNLKVNDYRAINDRRENLLYPSDHFPIICHFDFLK